MKKNIFYVFYIMKCLKLSKAKLIFFESWCRVRDLSLSGKLVKPIVDEFIVHWPELTKKYSNQELIIKKNKLTHNFDYLLIDANSLFHPICMKVVSDNTNIIDKQ